MTVFAVAGAVQGLLALGATVAVAFVLVLGDARRRAPFMILSLVLAALALLSVIGDQVSDALDGRLALGAAAALAGATVLVAGALVFRRQPGLVLVLAFATLPVRVPITVGGETANLLLPLYAVIASGVLARCVRVRVMQPEPRDARVRVVEKVLSGVLILFALQSLYSEDTEAAVRDICFFYIPFALLFRLLLDLAWTPKVVRRAMGFTVALALLCVAVGIAQFFTKDLLLANEKVLTANELKPYFRVNSLFFDPNIYGRFLALTMVLVAALLLWTPHRRVVYACCALLAALWAGLVPSLSESSFAALMAGLAVLAALRWRTRPVVLTVAAIAVAGAAAVIAFPSLAGLDDRSFAAIDRATAGRAELVRGGVDMFADRPFLGYGSGSFAAVYRERENLLTDRAPAESHTIPVTVAAEQGVVGLAAYVLLLFVSLSLVLRDARASLPRAAVAAAFVALVVHTLVYAAFLEDPLTWALLAAAAGLRRGEPDDAGAQPQRGGEDGTVYVHADAPAFTVRYDDDVLRVQEAGAGELLRLGGERKDVEATLVVTPLRLPPYAGQPTGTLPLYADDSARARDLDLTVDTRARLDGLPGYELGYAGGTTIFLVDRDAPGARDGVVLALTQTATGAQGGGQRVVRAARSALRSFQFGTERD